jgi:hypothetical protein
MGIDLRISLVFQTSLSRDYYNDHLWFDRDYEIFEQIEGFNTIKKIAITPPSLGCQSNLSHIEDIKIFVDKINRYKPDFNISDAYSIPLTWTLASEFSQLRIPEDISKKNKAILEFLEALPPDYMVILYWC